VGELILVLGGARSGKSTFAQQLAQELGGERVLFVATAEAGDDEMQERIEKHRQERPPSWQTVEAPRDAGPSIMARLGQAQVILLDCLTLLVSNLLTAASDPFAPEVEKQVVAQVGSLIDCVEQLDATMIIVSNEVGLGLVPPYPLGRAYRDLLGKANQILAQRAKQVYLMVAGIPMSLKQ
jgi:adenosylcobinamide kinase/adenosylcobinamide-phosphate guanylyltransferase